MTWQPSDEQVEAGARAMLGRFPVMDHDVPLGYRDLTDVDRNLIECAVFDTLIAAHAVQPPVYVAAFKRSVKAFERAATRKGTLSSKHILSDAECIEWEERIDPRIDAARQRLIDMYRERGL